MGGWSRLKDLDLYKKVERDLVHGTASGGFISIIGVAVMILLLVCEFSSLRRIDQHTEVQMDPQSSDLLPIYFNITFPEIKCQYLSVDVWNVLHTHRLNVTENIEKWRIDTFTNRTLGQLKNNAEHPQYDEEPSIDFVEGSNTQANAHPSGTENFVIEVTAANYETLLSEHELTLMNFFAPWCIWCQRLKPTWEQTSVLVQSRFQGAVGLASVDCTNPELRSLCDKNHVRAFPTVLAFKHGETHTHFEYLGNRKTESIMEFIEKNYKVKEAKFVGTPNSVSLGPQEAAIGVEGCRISGFVMVTKVPGSLHISADGYGNVLNEVNVSHYIDHLSFGLALTDSEEERLGGDDLKQTNTLEGQFSIATERNQAFDYYLRVSKYKQVSVNGAELQTYKYVSTASSFIEADDLPHSKFQFDPMPITVIVKESRTPFYHFITNLCAIIGGVFTVIGFFDHAVEAGVEKLRKKELLGKAE